MSVFMSVGKKLAEGAQTRMARAQDRASYEKSQLPSKKLKSLKSDDPIKVLRKEIKKKRDQRQSNQRQRQLPIEFRLKQFKDKKEKDKFTQNVLGHPNSKFWGAQDISLIKQELDFGKDYSNHNFRIKKANLKATVAALKKQGFKIDHTSKHNNLVSSYYMNKDGVRYRISDHDLPETPERINNREQGLGGNWDQEIIIDANTSIDSVISEVSDYNAQFKDPTSKNILAGSAATAVGAGTVLAPQDAEAGFFSQAVKAAGNLQRKTGNAAGFKNDLTGKGQVKPDELKAMGFDEHFGDRKDITKEEVQQFINDNQVQIKETRLGISQEYAVRPDPDEGFIVYNSTNGNHISSHATQELAADKALDLNVNSDNSKFVDYTLEGGDNYRELLMSLPRKAHPDQGKLDELLRSQDSEDYLSDLLQSSRIARDEWVALDQKHSALVWSDAAGGDGLTGAKLEEANQLYKKVQAAKVKWKQIDISLAKRRGDLREQIVDLQHEIKQEKRGQEFVNAGHFDEPNILAHLRMKDRVDADGNKTLLIEEAQSDWHQKGADVGYKSKDGSVSKPLQDEMDRIEQEMGRIYEASRTSDDPDVWMPLNEQFDNLNSELARLKYKAGGGVPDAPFKTDDKSSWYNLAMKRGLLEAIEGDYDKLAFTTGRQQAERYDLSKQINEVRLGGNERDGFTVSAFNKNDSPVIMESIDSLDELPNLIGKDAAKSLVDQPLTDSTSGKVKILAGQDLSVGGEGMKQFYDRTLPNTLNKLVKQDGVKVGQSGLLKDDNLDIHQVIDDTDERIDWLDVKSQVENYGNQNPTVLEKYDAFVSKYKPKTINTDTVHSINITPEMRDRVKKGLPLFAQGGAVVGAGALFSPENAQASVARPQQDGILKDTADVALETMSGINRAVVDGINFLTSDQINAVLNLSGSDRRIPNLYDLPYLGGATRGNYMDKGLPREIVRTGSEFLSPL